MIKLAPIPVEKPWGRTRLPPPFSMGNRPVGEIWFVGPAGDPLPLLVKYLFTSEKLSVQVHPSDGEAAALGLSAGKEECWYILEAEAGAQLGIGLRTQLSKPELREAVLSGEIEMQMQWHDVERGMVFHIPPGTIHAIGAGISLVEIQQNRDITYRLYDYGRGRGLHVTEGIKVADASPYSPSLHGRPDRTRSAIILRAEHFTLAQIADADISILPDGVQLFVVPIEGELGIGGETLNPGECGLVAAKEDMGTQNEVLLLVAWTRDPN